MKLVNMRRLERRAERLVGSSPTGGMQRSRAEMVNGLGRDPSVLRGLQVRILPGA